ncbi:Ca-activated chloride channel family protein [Geodermatophilus telluris]|uniref:Ca-activated chloride channel family protein n=1 Tax=Geodermatophilus telluris TaxID=1190417 RepID=A0A1G6NLP2_9ACTN|nr:VWA domain-containing protein [Geodermatophilus telluris]SDC68793.1 Ca-activated chloride channel family protein [Geodermatophilus telluris]
MSFQSPLWLTALVPALALGALYVVKQLRRRVYAARFSQTGLAQSLLPKRAGWVRHVAFGLTLAALFGLVLSLAQPSTEVRVPRETATVVLALDVSLSMQAEDIDPSRFEAMKDAASDFVDILPPRINLGLVSFSGTASTLVAPTTDREQVSGAIANLELSEATAIGEAIFTSLTTISTFQSSLDVAEEEELPPARILLLSDGYNTVGRENTQAIAAAQGAGVEVSTIAFGTDYGSIEIGGEVTPVPIDRDALRQIAEETGGQYNEARSRAELEAVYDDLGSQIGYTTEPQDVSYWFVRVSTLLLACGLGLAAWRLQRLF